MIHDPNKRIIKPADDPSAPAYHFDLGHKPRIGAPRYGRQQVTQSPEPTLGGHIQQRALDRSASVAAKNERESVRRRKEASRGSWSC